MVTGEQVISIPSCKVGLVTGRGGETIREICLVSGAHCQVDKTAPEGAREKNILIKGRPEAVERAKVGLFSSVIVFLSYLLACRGWSMRESPGCLTEDPAPG